MRRLLALLLWLGLCLGGLALAQAAGPTATPEAARAADQTVQAWLAGKYVLTPQQALDPQASRDPLALLRNGLRFQPPPRGGTTNLGLRRFEGRVPGSPGEPPRETYRYPVSAGTQVLPYSVTVEQVGGRWQARSVRPRLEGAGLPGWLRAPGTVVVFALLSLALVGSAFVRGPVRTALGRALAIAREQRLVFILVNVLLYGLFFAGMAFGAAYPAIARELSDLLGGSLSATGIQDFRQNVPAFALGIFSWNFTSGALLTTFVPGLLLGVPAVLVNVVRLFILGTALAPGPQLPAAALWLHVPTILIELQGYIFIAASALAWVVRWFKLGFLPAWRGYAYCLAPAALLLVLGAWYEAVEILVLIPQLVGR